ncbi:hypothetical protein [Stagnihabitans tardus]|uniref:Uncharacterized protein n=1 Tax=Stagnihabitans tardus TaxID=2699202 RepID=A0AAE5BVR0_9RHOB|nr:hypothetical protein [Stagnihabitans tardus]NBZ89226.1 hypothetical protein [Stagnihabitans tardus]
MAMYATLEAELFSVLVELLGDQRLERNALRVLAGARGHELGRPYLNLCQQGLIEETRVQPGFFRRLFGARETLWVRVTDYGQKVAATMAEHVPAEPAPVALETPPFPRQPDPAPLETSDVATAQPQPSTVVDVAPMGMPQHTPVRVVVPDPLPEVTSIVAPSPAPQSKRPPAPRRFTPLDFTETLGGTPLDSGFQIPASDRLDGLSEAVGLLGFELTDAGKLLAVSRWAQGLTDVQVALEIVTSALAHAVRLDAMGTAKLDREAAAGLVSRLTETFQAYVAEGLLEAESLYEVSSRMEGFLGGPPATSDLDAYLADPHRGMAPTAVCPDDIYLRTEVEED